MITYIELWKSKQAWKDLSKEERKNYLNAMKPAIQKLTDNGVQILSWGKNETFTFHKVDYDYFAVWTFGNTEAARSFQEMVQGSGWYNYFDQVNAMGTSTNAEEVMNDMISI